MGLAMPNTASTPTATMAEAAPTFCQVMPEKLPCDQPWRFTMSDSRAKVMTKSVTAEQM